MKNMTRFKAFADMIDSYKYADYVKQPYKLDEANTDYSFPLINPDTGNIVRFDTKVLEKIKNNKILENDPRIKDLKKIWVELDTNNNLLIEGNAILIDKTPYKIGRS